MGFPFRRKGGGREEIRAFRGMGWDEMGLGEDEDFG